MDVFVTRAVTKIRKLSSRKQRGLRESCDSVLKSLKDNDDSMADKYVSPLLLACETKHPKMTEIALDCLQKLIAYGYLRGNTEDSSEDDVRNTDDASSDTTNNEQKNLMEIVINTISQCNEHPDSSVQLQVIKALVTAVTSSTCAVHGKSLLNSIRACYHINLSSKNQTNQTVAKATLQQMLNIVFQRMETFDLKVVQENRSSVVAIANGSPASQKPVDVTDKSMYPEVKTVLGFKLVNKFVSPPPALIISTNPPPLSNNETTRSKTPATTNRTVPVTPSQKLNAFPSVLHYDSYLLFRSMCRLSNKGSNIDDGSGSHDPLALSSKVLAFELILVILQSSGPTFRRFPPFIHLVRENLCASLIKNSVCSSTELVDLSLRIFVVLMTHFKEHLKGEIELFISDIFLRILESSNSPFEHKAVVLQAILKICQDSAVLGEIFLNYDCDWNSVDLFKRIVIALAKASKGGGFKAGANSAEGSSPGGGGTGTANASGVKLSIYQEDFIKQIKALECLVAILSSLKKTVVACEDALLESVDEVEAAENEVPTTAPSEVPPPSTGVSVVKAFDLKQRTKEEMATGIIKFNVKPSVGIKYLVSHGHLQKDPKSVALFLLDNASKLNMTQVGDYLGKEQSYQDGFCIQVLHEYVDNMDFSQMDFDVAIRHCLSGFRLPGESQKIDRIMEKFAERYCINNPNVFPSADTAFILAFSVIMLQTDLHNPSVREDRKMTKDGFIRNNRGINAGEDLPDEFLGDIFDRIAMNPISLKEDEDARARTTASDFSTTMFTSASTVDRQRREAFHREVQMMVQASEAKRKANTSVSNRGSKNNGRTIDFSDYCSVSDVQVEHIRPMFEMVWAPVLASCSMMLEMSSDTEGISLCLKAIVDAIHLSSVFKMDSERDAFVISLANFTGLRSFREMLPKHIEGIKTLVSIAVNEGPYLGDSWSDILQCISELARLQMLASGAHSDTEFFPTSNRSTNVSDTSSVISTSSPPIRGKALRTPSSNSLTSSGRRSSGSMFGSTPINRLAAMRGIEYTNATQISKHIDALAIDRVFSSSVRLPDQAIQTFVQQLCVVSLSELAGGSSNNVALVASENLNQPRVFSLQKLVEVADMNMSIRSRMVWSRVWEVLGRHFTTVGCNDNHSVAMFAIDSLRQLSAKFLEKQELKAFNFQRLFLRPFEIIISNSQSCEIKELILRCVENVILARGAWIKSGWKSLVAVFSVASKDDAESVLLACLHVLSQVVENHFIWIVPVLDDAVKCLLSLATNTNASVSITVNALNGLQICMKNIADGKLDDEGVQQLLSPPYEHSSSKEQQQHESTYEHFDLWWLILSGISQLAKSDHETVRLHSIDIIFTSLSRYGTTSFERESWIKLLDGLIFPIFSSVEPSQTYLLSTYEASLLRLVRLFSEQFVHLEFSFSRIIKVIRNFMAQEKTSLVLLGLSGLRQLLLSSGRTLSSSHWEAVVKLLVESFEAFKPSHVMEATAKLVPEPSVTSHTSESMDDFLNGVPSPTLHAAEESAVTSPRRGGTKNIFGEYMYPQVCDSLSYNVIDVPSSQISQATTPTTTHTMLQSTLVLQRIVGDILTEDSLTEKTSPHVQVLVDLLSDSFNFARTFNDSFSLRQALKTTGLASQFELSDKFPSMLPQELEGKRQYLRIFFKLYLSESIGQFKAEPLISLVKTVVEEYISWSQTSSDNNTEALDHLSRSTRYVPLVIDIVIFSSKFSAQQFMEHKDWLYPMAVSLVQCDDKELRVALCELFNGPIAGSIK